MGAAESAPSGGRVKAIQDWLARRADTAIGRLGMQWFRAYMAASRNSACAVTLYSSLSVLPVALVAIAYFHIPSSDASAFADSVVAHLRLEGDTAELVHTTFASASSNLAAATIGAVVGFLLWGIGIGQLIRDVYARAWGLPIELSASDQARFTVFFFVLSGVVALSTASSVWLHGAGWAFLLVAWSAGSMAFWLWTPAYLLRRALPLQALVPGALLATLLLGGTIVTAPFWLSAGMNKNGQAFGAFGVVLTLVGYYFVLITMALACAVFAPVWAQWRLDERARGSAP